MACPAENSSHLIPSPVSLLPVSFQSPLARRSPEMDLTSAAPQFNSVQPRSTPRQKYIIHGSTLVLLSRL